MSARMKRLKAVEQEVENSGLHDRLVLYRLTA